MIKFNSIILFVKDGNKIKFKEIKITKKNNILYLIFLTALKK